MLDLAICITTDRAGVPMILTNHGKRMKCKRWPQDCEFQVVAFSSSARAADVIGTEHLLSDLRAALRALETAGELTKVKPAWYRRLTRYAAPLQDTNRRVVARQNKPSSDEPED